MPRYSYIIWDWNGTILDDTRLCVAIANEMLARRRLPTLSLTQYRAAFRFPVRDYYLRVGFDLTAEPFEDLCTEFITAYEQMIHECGLQDGARAMLEHIKSNASPQSILSAYEKERLAEIITRHELDHFFDQVIGVDDIAGTSKIDQGKRLIESLDIARSEVLLIGDTLHDAEVASELGVQCLLVAHGHQSKDVLQSSGVPTLDSLEALRSVL